MDPRQVPSAVHEIDPPTLAARIKAGTAPRIIDVREPYEWQIAHLATAELKPLSEIRQWWRELDPREELVFHCHHGQRSLAVCQALAAEGFTQVVNLSGGIHAWSLEVDPSLPQY
jgi:rhodanese-related sulfurtransferase